MLLACKASVLGMEKEDYTLNARLGNTVRKKKEERKKKGR